MTNGRSATIGRRLGRLAAAVGVAAVVSVPAAAAAQTYVDGEPPPEVEEEFGVPREPVGGETERAVTAQSGAERDTLPFTGGDVLGLAALGAGAVAIGGAMALGSRRAAARSQAS